MHFRNFHDGIICLNLKTKVVESKGIELFYLHGHI